MTDIVLTNIRTLVSCDPARSTPNNPLGRIEDAVLALSGDTIAWVGPREDLPQAYQPWPQKDTHHAVVFPGFIDSHTHPVFAGGREVEFARRIAGVPYMQIAAEGGGINATVRATREAGLESLKHTGRGWLLNMLHQGVTTVESKSGYGLSTQSELTMLQAIKELNEELPLDLIPTFMGAHEFPPEYREQRDAYVDLVIREMIPEVARRNLASFCDVFCEEGVFTVEQSRRILQAGREAGMSLRFHADEFVDSGGAELAAELGAVACDHLMAVSDKGMEAMARKGVMACLLPGTSYYLGKKTYANAQAFKERGIPVVLASDFNPGSCVISSLPLVMNMGCTQLRMPFEDVILAVTRFAAQSLLLSDRGVLTQGMRADVILTDMPTPEFMVYHVGRNHVREVFKNGASVWQNPNTPLFMDS